MDRFASRALMSCSLILLVLPRRLRRRRLRRFPKCVARDGGEFKELGGTPTPTRQDPRVSLRAQQYERTADLPHRDVSNPNFKPWASRR